jgi:mannose-6-phosphate isomerase-like protein (cupin superfamily)
MSEELDFPFQVTGEKRAQALAHCQDTIRAWGLTMPDVEPLLLDFGLGRFDEVGETEFWIANDPETGYCGKFLFVADGQTCPYHHHGMKHETFFMVKGTLRLVLDGEEMLLREGETLVVPPGQRHSFTGVGPALLLEVSMPSVRQDNFFADSAIGDDGVI